MQQLLRRSVQRQQRQRHLRLLLPSILAVVASISNAEVSGSSSRASSAMQLSEVSKAAASTEHAPAAAAAASFQEQQFLTQYYTGQLPRERLAAAQAAAGKFVSLTAKDSGPQRFDWADPAWGEYRELAVVPVDGTDGLPIWGWDAVIPQVAINQTILVLRSMLLELQDDITQRLLSYPGVKVALFKRPEQKATDIPEHRMFPELAHRAGMGGTKSIPVTTCDIENIMETSWDPYNLESILVHEFAHAIHLIGMSDCQLAAVRTAYTSARSAGAYSEGAYMIADEAEYFACATQGWFGASSRSDVNEGIVSRARLWAHDPTLFRLFRYVYKSHVVHWNYKNSCPRCNEKWPSEANVTASQALAAPLLSIRASGLAECTLPATPTNTTSNPDSNSNPQNHNPARPVPSIPGDCKDILPATICQSLVQQNGCQTRRGYAMRNCKDTCFCTSLCQDTRTTCERDALLGLCDTDPEVMSSCMRSCGLCYMTTSPNKVAGNAGKSCRDKNAMCYIGANVHGNCTQEAFRAECPFSCGMC